MNQNYEGEKEIGMALTITLKKPVSKVRNQKAGKKYVSI